MGNDVVSHAKWLRVFVKEVLRQHVNPKVLSMGRAENIYK
jgi:hypothetical protein